MVEMKMKRRKFLLAGTALVTLPAVVFARDAKWANPIKLDGMPNLNLVAPNLYRSAQPTAEGFEAAQEQLHLQTSLSLRETSNDADLLVGTQIDNQLVPMNAAHITDAKVIAALKIIRTAQAKGPVLVHCLHGADRTGVVIAMYRVLYQGWSKDEAIDELKNGGFNFHSIFFNIPHFIQNADIAQFKQALAITP
jgi:protein tyrosine/serine phosphatase